MVKHHKQSNKAHGLLIFVTHVSQKCLHSETNQNFGLQGKYCTVCTVLLTVNYVQGDG